MDDASIGGNGRSNRAAVNNRVHGIKGLDGPPMGHVSNISHHLNKLERCHVLVPKAEFEKLIWSLSRKLFPHCITYNCTAPSAMSNIPIGRIERIAVTVSRLVGLYGGFRTGQTFRLKGGSYLG